MSWATDLSPTACLLSVLDGHDGCMLGWVGGGVYPGWVGTGVGWEGYTGYYPIPSQDPYLTIFSLKISTYGQMKAISRFLMRFLRYGLELTSFDPQI